MSSLVRRIQVRALKRLDKKKQPIVSNRGNILGRKWPIAKGQIFFLSNLSPVFPWTKHPTLQPVIDALTPKEPVAQAA